MRPIVHETIFFLHSNPRLFLCSIAGWLLLPLLVVVSLIMSLLRIRVLTSHVGVPSFRFIGHLTLEMDGFFKDRALGRHLDFTPIVIYPRDLAANRTMLALWSQKCRIISHPVIARLLRPLVFIPWCSHSIRHYAPGVASVAQTDVYRRYQNGPPLIRLDEAMQARGHEYLRRYLPGEDGWYVCLHVRTQGYYHNPSAELRDARIETYLGAVEEIVAQGGWVFRMGDPSMPKLPQLRNVVDYAHASERCDFLDVFLASQCRFFLGTASGLCAVATAFGVPLAIANQCGPPIMPPPRPGDLFIPKLIAAQETGRMLSLKELVDSRLSDLQFSECLKANELVAIECTCDDIRDVAIEMLKPYGHDDPHYEKIMSLRRSIAALITPTHAAYASAGDFGGRFLLKHEAALFRADASPFRKKKEFCGTEDCDCFRAM